MKFICTLAYDHQKDYYYSLDDSICDFILYYNDRLCSITKVAPCKVIMDASDNELMGKNKEKHPKNGD